MLKNVTFSVETTILRRARSKAQGENTTLNRLFREWLERYVGQGGAAEEYESLMARLDYCEPGRRFTRDELNER